MLAEELLDGVLPAGADALADLGALRLAPVAEVPLGIVVGLLLLLLRCLLGLRLGLLLRGIRRGGAAILLALRVLAVGGGISA